MSTAKNTADYLQDALDSGDFMAPASENDLNNLAVIHALRATADGMKRIADQQLEAHKQMTAALEGIHEIDKRLAVIEANSLTHRVEALDARVLILENDRQRRIGAVGLVDWLGKNWPAVLAFAATVTYVLSSQDVVL